MIILDQKTLDYLLHRCGEKKLTSSDEMSFKDLAGNSASANFLETFGNSTISAYVGFIDLCGFSTRVQGKNPEQIQDYLRPFLEKVISILTDRGAMVDKMIGDEIMFILPEIEETAEPPQIFLLGQIMGRLCELAFELQFDYRYRIGLSFGQVNIFQVKGKGYSEWTTVGEPIHVAKRLHGLKELESPNPVCGAFGISLNNQPIESITKIMREKLNIIVGTASRYKYELAANPVELKGVCKVLWAYLEPK